MSTICDSNSHPMHWRAWRPTSSHPSMTPPATITISSVVMTMMSSVFLSWNVTSITTEPRVTPSLKKMLLIACISPLVVFPMWKTSTRIIPSTSMSVTSSIASQYVLRTLRWDATSSSTSRMPCNVHATARISTSLGINSASPCVNMKRKWALSMTSPPFDSCACS